METRRCFRAARRRREREKAREREAPSKQEKRAAAVDVISERESDDVR
jgi:hypothetical protein